MEVLLKRSSTWRQVWETWTMDNALESQTNTGGFGGRPSLKNDGERTFRKGSCSLQIFQKRFLLDLTRAQSSNNKVIKHLYCFLFEINENESALIMVSKLNPLFCTVVDTNWSLKERCTTDDMSTVSARVPAILLLLIEYVGKYENNFCIYKYN